MPLQLLLPDFPDGATRIAYGVHLLKQAGIVTYFLGSDNFFHHRVEDTSSYRFVLASLMDNGHVRPCELEEAPLCLPHRTLMNWLDQLRTRGPDSFFRPSHRSGSAVVTPDVVARCEQLLARDLSVASVAQQAGIGDSTLRKAPARGAIRRPGPDAGDVPADTGSTKSERSRADAEAALGLGTACTRADERMAAAVGLAECATARFEHSSDVMMGGLLAGLPALCANGLFSGLGKYLRLPNGFYGCLHVLLVLGFMALGRIRRPEGFVTFPRANWARWRGWTVCPKRTRCGRR